MYRHIMVPIDLAQLPAQRKALDAAAALAGAFDAAVTYVGVAAPAASGVAHSPEEHRAKLDAFAAQEGARIGGRAAARLVTVSDPATEIDAALRTALDELAADLVVMATHAPGLADRLWSGHGATLAAHAPASVLLVR